MKRRALVLGILTLAMLLPIVTLLTPTTTAQNVDPDRVVCTSEWYCWDYGLCCVIDECFQGGRRISYRLTYCEWG